MKVHYTELSGRYAAMSVDDLTAIKREDLADEAIRYFDEEMVRRVPGWTYQVPLKRIDRETIRSMQRSLRIKFWLTVGCWGVILLALFVVLLELPPQMDQLWHYLQTAILLLMLLLPYSSRGAALRTGYIVLWLRRFHRREQKPFQALLDEACRYTGMAITIQDTSFRNSINFAVGRFVPLMAALALGYVVLGLFSPEIVLDTIGLAACLTGVAVMVAANCLGYMKLRPEDAENTLMKTVEKMRAGTMRNAGIIVLRCADSFWQEVVRRALMEADAVLVDVSETSENVVWELHTALSIRPPQGIVLACASRDGNLVELPQAVRQKLQAALDVPLEQFPIFLYPANLPRVRWNQKWTVALRGALTESMLHAPARELGTRR